MMQKEKERKKVRVTVKPETRDMVIVLESERWKTLVYLVSSLSTSRLSAFKGHY